jgi:hypothetical protein
MPFYAPGGLKSYIQRLLREGQEFEESLPENFPRNLVSPEEIKVVHAAISRVLRDVGHLHAYLAQIDVAHRESHNIVSATEWIIMVKNIRPVAKYLEKLQRWVHELDEIKDALYRKDTDG